jgi:hypothetical protein
MNPAMKTKMKALLVTLLCLVALVAIFQAPLRWTALKIHREIFPEQVPERPVYDDTAKAPVDLANFVRDARRAWPKVAVSRVHAVALAVATGLLLRSDIEVGSMVDGKFVPWHLAPWNAAEKIRDEIGGMSGFLSDQGRYIFRRKTV